MNFDLPQVAEDYVHRIGRTGRAGADGQAISLVCADEINQLKDIERLLKKRIERIEIDDFEPSHTVPSSNITPGAPRRSNNGSRPAARPSQGRPAASKEARPGNRNQQQARKRTS